MEIEPVPRRRKLSSRARLLLALAVLTPVTLFALMPAMFGLERYVISSDSMAGSIDRGSVVFERVVPVGDLEVGDVITFRPPDGYGESGLVTHRIVEMHDGYLRTQGDANPAPDAWVLSTTTATQERVVFHVPYVGYPFLGSARRTVWLVVLLVPLLLLALARATDVVRRRHHQREPRLL